MCLHCADMGGVKGNCGDPTCGMCRASGVDVEGLKKLAQGWLDAAQGNREAEKDYGVHVRPQERVADAQEFCGHQLLEFIRKHIAPPEAEQEESK